MENIGTQPTPEIPQNSETQEKATPKYTYGDLFSMLFKKFTQDNSTLLAKFLLTSRKCVLFVKGKFIKVGDGFKAVGRRFKLFGGRVKNGGVSALRKTGGFLNRSKKYFAFGFVAAITLANTGFFYYQYKKSKDTPAPVAAAQPTVAKPEVLGVSDAKVTSVPVASNAPTATTAQDLKLPDTATPDIFITAVPVDLAQIEQISRFRSCKGSDFSGYNTAGKLEKSRSMRHYFAPLQSLINSDKVKVYAPFEGTISKIEDDQGGRGKTVTLKPKVTTQFVFVISNVNLNANFKQGSSVKSAEAIGHVNLTKSREFNMAMISGEGEKRILDSIFLHMKSEVYGVFKAKGYVVENMIVAKEVRDVKTCAATDTNDLADDWIKSK